MIADGPRWHDRLLRVLAGLLAIDAAAIFVLNVAAIIIDDRRYFRGDLLMILVLIGVYLVPALVAAGLIRRGCSERTMGAAIFLTLVAMVAAIIDLDRVAYSRLYANHAVGTTATMLCLLLLLHGGLRLLASNARAVRWARGITLGIAGLTAVIVILRSWFEYEFWWGGRLAAYRDHVSAAVVGGVALTLLSALAARALYRRERSRHGRIDASLPKRVTLTMNCPRCGEALAAPTGDYRCPACRFAMEIIIEEPRCECGYLIYEQTSANCTECGRAIPEQDRWREVRSHEP